jgi:acetyl coenzyme A synthetase (ADP forming)-like protein
MYGAQRKVISLCRELQGSMEGFFTPGSVAVIGASSDRGKVGGMVINNLLGSGFKGEIYPINPKGGEIQGLRAYESVDKIGKVPDLAVICIKAEYVLGEIERLGAAGVRRAIIITAGFREESDDGRIMEERIGAAVRKYGMRVIGPNCFGVMNTSEGLNTTFSSLFPVRGNIALTSQSGAVGASMLDWSLHSGIGISKFASLGNKMDVGEPELLDYLMTDDETQVIGMYAESISDGPGFIRAVTAMNDSKPLVILKSGRTGAGSKAASSHTGALAGADSVFNVLFKKLNITRVYDLDEMFDALSVFSLCGRMERDGVVIITNAGGLGVMAADACSSYPHINMAELSSETIRAIEEALPTVASAINPVDVRGDAPADAAVRVLEIVAKDPSVGGAVILSAPLDTADLDSMAELISEANGRTDIPIAVSFTGGVISERASAVMRRNGVPTFSDPDRAVRALEILRAREMEVTEDSTPLVFPETDGRAKARDVIDRAREEGRISLSEEEGKAILAAYGIPVPKEDFATSAQEAVRAAEAVGYPVVMKIQSPDIHHKTDVGGVIVGIRDEEGVRNAYESILASCCAGIPGARVDGVSVEQMVSGQEVILSMIRDDQFGPIISFGLGGIYVEIMGEISQAMLPMNEQDLDRLIMSTKAYRMLSGARGRPPADIDSLKDIILRLIRIAEDNEEIYELEINPVMVGERNEGSWAVDALATLRWK